MTLKYILSVLKKIILASSDRQSNIIIVYKFFSSLEGMRMKEPDTRKPIGTIPIFKNEGSKICRLLIKNELVVYYGPELFEHLSCSKNAYP